MALIDKLTALGDAIRVKTGGTAPLTLDQMVTEINGISTGVELNFNVIGGTTQPSNPKENDIWIETSTAITDWVVSPTQPTTSNGLVWILMDKSSTMNFNALKENAIQVYPHKAQQYINGVLSPLNAYIYQGAWKQFSYKRTYLFESGYGKRVPLTDYYEYGNSTTITNDYVYFKGTGAQAALRTTNKVNLSQYTKLCAEVTCAYAGDNDTSIYTGGLRVASSAWTTANSIGGDNYGSAYVALGHFSKHSNKRTYTLNITNITGSYYVGISGGYGGYIYNMWLE